MLLEVREIVKRYGATTVLRGVSLAAAAGEIVCLLGPSGCGKSTLLRVIAGLESDYQGTVRFAGQPIDRVPVHRRGFGFMFQEFALLPHRSVGENIAFGLRMQRRPRAEIERRVAEMLELVGLRGYAARSIFELSGGERQRVALARSLAPAPRLLLLDEPLGALDRTLRERLTDELRAMLKRAGITSVYVTHDQLEAFAIADRVLLMQAGRIVQSGTPMEVYRHPASLFAARFLGLTNLIPGQVLARAPELIVATPLGQLRIDNGSPPPHEQVTVLIRPEAARPAAPDSVNLVEGLVTHCTFRGGTQRIGLRHASGITLELDLEAGAVAEGQRARLALRPTALTVLAPTDDTDPSAAADMPAGLPTRADISAG
ncbi:ABC transporter ATP-binding protein [Kallotenue papyrolyticum]|uniref:ABC transporter ATP-binding protein n=1 Tax=Kallotenue papyrolyticum TaxID=1325125 RepID=UPI0004ADAC71|nr:ABC transporter ATP-binding protein [Kallotenue papyrolyticum]